MGQLSVDLDQWFWSLLFLVTRCLGNLKKSMDSPPNWCLSTHNSALHFEWSSLRRFHEPWGNLVGCLLVVVQLHHWTYLPWLIFIFLGFSESWAHRPFKEKLVVNSHILCYTLQLWLFSHQYYLMDIFSHCGDTLDGDCSSVNLDLWVKKEFFLSGFWSSLFIKTSRKSNFWWFLSDPVFELKVSVRKSMWFDSWPKNSLLLPMYNLALKPLPVTSYQCPEWYVID